MPNASTLLEPKLVVRPSRKDDPLEVSVHTLPKPLLREFRHVFAENYLWNDDETMGDGNLEILAIPTNQQARQDLVAVGDEIEQEKDRLLNVVSTLPYLRLKVYFCVCCCCCFLVLSSCFSYIHIYMIINDD